MTRAQRVADRLKVLILEDRDRLPHEIQRVAWLEGIDLAQWFDSPPVRALGIKHEEREIYPGRKAMCWALPDEAEDTSP